MQLPRKESSTGCVDIVRGSLASKKFTSLEKSRIRALATEAFPAAGRAQVGASGSHRLLLAWQARRSFSQTGLFLTARSLPFGRKR
eukprot:3515806-Pyramimonas_sp.AAC.1